MDEHTGFEFFPLDAHDLLEEMCASEALRIWLLADYGKYLAVRRDGTVFESDTDMCGAAVAVKVPGRGNIDMSRYTSESFDEEENEDGETVWRDEYTGAVLTTTEECVLHCIEHGDMIGELDDIEQAIGAQLREQEENRRLFGR